MITLPDKSYSRVIVVQILYIFELSGKKIEDLNNESIERYIGDINTFYNSDELDDSEIIRVMRNKTKQKFIKTILNAYSESKDDIDKTIINVLDKKDSWDRVHILIKSILRAALAEFIHINTKRSILIDEYVSITSSFFSSKEISFVNATLDKIIKNIEKAT